MTAPLDPGSFAPADPRARVGRRILCLDRIDGTNAEAARILAREGPDADGTVIFAEHQAAGRGRLGRSWHSPRGASLLLTAIVADNAAPPLVRESLVRESLLAPPPSPEPLVRESLLAPSAASAAPPHAFGAYLMLGASIAVCDAARDAADVDPAIRWPNDVFVRDRKLAGVLVESFPLPAGRRAYVVGIGLNCLQQRSHFPRELRDRATSLELESPHPVDRAAVARALLQRLDRLVRDGLDADHPSDPAAAGATAGATAAGARIPGARIPSRTLNPLLDTLTRRWRDRSADVGRRTTLQHDGRRYTGTILDVDPTGGLLVQLDEGPRRLFDPFTTSRIE